VVMNCHVQQKVKVGKTVCDEASVVPWEVHSRDKALIGLVTRAALQLWLTLCARQVVEAARALRSSFL